MVRPLELEVLDANNSYIYANDPNADIYPLEDVKFNQDYIPEFPYIVNTNIPKPIFRNRTVADLRADLPADICYVLDNYDVVLCGGYLYKLFIQDMEYNGVFDIDLFLVDTNKDPKHLTEKVDAIIKHLVDGKQCQYVKNNRNIVEMLIGYQKDNIVEMTKVQIILRIYDAPSQIIHGFDLGSCSVAFDGKQVWFTTMAKFAYEYGYNIVCMDRRSDSYEYRLKKYFKRGFGIIMPNFKLDSDDSPGIIDRLYNYLWMSEKTDVDIPMPSMEIQKATVKGNRILTTPSHIRTSYSRKSDYGEAKFTPGSVAALSRQNSHIVASDEDRPLLSVETPEWGNKYIKSYDRSQLDPKISFTELDPLQVKLLKEIFDLDEDPNDLMKKKIEQIANKQKSNMVKNGYQFSYIVADHQHYGIFNAVTSGPKTWYGKYYKDTL